MRMSLREQLEQSGQWLFRWRSYLPVLMGALVLLALVTSGHDGDESFPPYWEAICLAVAALGVAVRGVVTGWAPGGTSGRQTTAPAAGMLNMTGIYSVVRHPLYVGNYFLWLGVVMLPASGWLVLVTTLIFWVYYERIMFAEEEFLRRRFGAEFEAWADRTPAVIPDPGLWRPSSVPFSVRNVLRREPSGWLALAVTFTAVDVLRQLIRAGQVAIDSADVVVPATALAIFLALEALKKGTRVLHVEGR